MKDISAYMQEAHYANTSVIQCKCKECRCGGEVPFIAMSEVCSLCLAGKHVEPEYDNLLNDEAVSALKSGYPSVDRFMRGREFLTGQPKFCAYCGQHHTPMCDGPYLGGAFFGDLP